MTYLPHYILVTYIQGSLLHKCCLNTSLRIRPAVVLAISEIKAGNQKVLRNTFAAIKSNSLRRNHRSYIIDFFIHSKTDLRLTLK